MIFMGFRILYNDFDMTRLSISVMGPFEARLNNVPVSQFESNKSRALLAYLSCESGNRHTRDALGETLWETFSPSVQLANLRHTLYDLRKTIQDQRAPISHLTVTNKTVQFNIESDCWVDYQTFQEIAGKFLHTQNPPFQSQQDELELLTHAANLYKGEFLEGFAIDNSVGFEHWIRQKRELIDRQTIMILHRLAILNETNRKYDLAEQYTRRLIELEPYDEKARQNLMRLLVIKGQRPAALMHYDEYRRFLIDELGVEPAQETTSLYQDIWGDHLARSEIKPQQLPGIIDHPTLARDIGQTELKSSSQPLFVARESELLLLSSSLQRALQGSGNIAFISGEIGSGKTSLLETFVQQALEKNEMLLAVFGYCNMQSGIGDPYLPFIEALQMLTSDNVSCSTAHFSNSFAVQRLLAALQGVIPTLLEFGPDLIDYFVSGNALLKRSDECVSPDAPYRPKLAELINRHASLKNSYPNVQQGNLFDQFTRVIRAVSEKWPVILALEDLHWADNSSISLLFHLGRRLAGSRVMVIGTFRKEDVQNVDNGEQHPLVLVTAELLTNPENLLLNLDLKEDRRFVDALLDSEPNQLREDFRQTLYEHTLGHALFTVELVRGLKDRGDLVLDASGKWIVKDRIHWESLPRRVESAVARHIQRLPPVIQEALTVASVEGEVFTAEIVAEILGVDEKRIFRQLSGLLEYPYRLVNALGVQWAGGKRLSRYRFRHHLFQKYFYSRLDGVEVAHLHQEVGNALERLYCNDDEKLAVNAPRLASHFHLSGLIDKAVDYLLLAGKRASLVSARSEAMHHYKNGMSLLRTLPESRENLRKELDFQLGLGSFILATTYWGNPDLVKIYDRAYELCQKPGDSLQLSHTLAIMGHFSWAQSDYRKAIELGKQSLNLARRSNDLQQVVVANWMLGENYYFLGEYQLAHEHLQDAVEVTVPDQYQALTFFTGADILVTCLSYNAWVLWALGYPEKALRYSNDAIHRAELLQHHFTSGFALVDGPLIIRTLRQEYKQVIEWANCLVKLATETNLNYYQSLGRFFQGWGISQEGNLADGIALMLDSMAEWKKQVSTQPTRLKQLVLLAGVCAQAKKAEKGLAALEEAVVLSNQQGGRYYDAEIERLIGEMVLIRNKPDAQRDAEQHFQRAIDLSRRKGAKMWELRSSGSLARLWASQGKKKEAHPLISDIYEWFTEGFDTPDLVEAKTLINSLL